MEISPATFIGDLLGSLVAIIIMYSFFQWVAFKIFKQLRYDVLNIVWVGAITIDASVSIYYLTSEAINLFYVLDGIIYMGYKAIRYKPQERVTTWDKRGEPKEMGRCERETTAHGRPDMSLREESEVFTARRRTM